MILTSQNYTKGFLVDEETIAGVTEMGDARDLVLYAAYVSHALTGETLTYREFERLDDALDFLNSLKQLATYEGVGCSEKTGASKPATGCGTGACSSCG